MPKTIKHPYVPHSPFVHAAMDLMTDHNATFSKFGTLDEELARVHRKPEWKFAARAMFENGDVANARLQHDGEGKHLEFHIEFKPRQSSFRTRPQMVTPRLVISIASKESLRKQVDIYKEQAKLGTVTKNSVDGGAQPGESSDRGADRWTTPGKAI